MESPPAERRSRPRRRLDQLAYIGFGPDSGGVLLDVSEEGLRCQIVGAVNEGERCHVKFALPGRSGAIEADGRVVWSNGSRQGGGVRLVGLHPEIRKELQHWISDETACNAPRRPDPRLLKTRITAMAPAPDVVEPPVPTPPAIAAEQPSTQEATAETVKVPLVCRLTPERLAARKPRRAKASPEESHWMPLTIPHLDSDNSLFTPSNLLALCVVATVVVLAFSGF